MGEEKTLLSDLFHGFAKLFDPSKKGSGTSKRSATARAPRPGEVAQELEQLLQTLKTRAEALREEEPGSLAGEIRRHKLTRAERLAEQKQAMAAIHAQIRKDVLALHRDLGTGLTDGDLLAARTLLLEAEKLSTEKHGNDVECRLRTGVAGHLFKECKPLAWQCLVSRMTKAGLSWPDPPSLSPREDAKTAAMARERELSEAEHAFESASPARAADLLFGIVQVWRANYPEPDSAPWKRTVIEAVGYGILGHLAATAAGELRGHSDRLRSEVTLLMADQMEAVQATLREGIHSVSEADELITGTTRMCKELVPELAWQAVAKTVHEKAEAIAAGAGAA